MATILNDGNIRVWAVPTIADLAEPSPTELNAGDALECVLSADGGLVGFSPDIAQVDASSLCNTYDVTVPGRLSFSGTGLKFNKQSGTDEIFDLLINNYLTHIVIRRDIPSTTAWTAGQPVEVYPVRCAERQEGETAKNSVHTYTVPLGIVAPPQLRAEVTT